MYNCGYNNTSWVWVLVIVFIIFFLFWGNNGNVNPPRPCNM